MKLSNTFNVFHGMKIHGRILNQLAIAAIATAVTVLTANATMALTITFGGTSIPGKGEFSTVPGATTIDFESGAPTSGMAIYSLPSPRTGVVDDFDVSVPRSDVVSWNDGKVTDSLWDDNDSKYLRIGAIHHHYEPVVIEFAQLQDYFGLFWELGSATHIGRYGEVSFYRDETLIQEFDSSHEVARAAGLQEVWFPRDTYVNFLAATDELFNKVVLDATWWAQFESDNHAYRAAALTPVPEPASVFGVLTLGALGVGSRLRKRKE